MRSIIYLSRGLFNHHFPGGAVRITYDVDTVRELGQAVTAKVIESTPTGHTVYGTFRSHRRTKK